MTQTSKHQGEPQPPVVPSGAEIYAMIMRQIEPDLLKENIPGLDGKYAGETPENRKERGKRYKAAFEEYHRLFEQFMQGLRDKTKQYRRELFSFIEQQADNKDSGLAKLEAALIPS